MVWHTHAKHPDAKRLADGIALSVWIVYMHALRLGV